MSALPRFKRLKCKCKRKCKHKKRNFFHFLCWCLPLHLPWYISHMYFLAFAFASHVWTRLKDCYEVTTYTTVFDCLTKEYNCHLVCIQINNHGFWHNINVLEKELKVNKKKTVGTIFTQCPFHFPKNAVLLMLKTGHLLNIVHRKL